MLIPRMEDVLPELPTLLMDNDLVLLMGAGNIEALAQQLREDLQAQGQAA